MESRAKIAGHPVHPMLIVFPLGLLIMALIFDGIYLATDNTAFATTAFWNIGAGCIGGLAAAVFGLIDWLAIPHNTRAKAVGAWHGVMNVVVVLLFAASFLSRLAVPTYLPGAWHMTLEILAVSIGAVSGWLGGELVDRLGVGVDTGAHLNSPSSLSNRPASDNSPTPLRQGMADRDRDFAGRPR
jgi:uncharacterized membrane protein